MISEKYPVQLAEIPQSHRMTVNMKILHLITNGLVGQSNITPADIYNSYTGDGGLHGLSQEDFDNYHDYAEAKKEIEQGQFFTAPAVCQYIIECLRPSTRDIVFDLTCGMGSFFNFLPAEQNIYGADTDLKALKVAKYLFPKAHLSHEDIRSYEPKVLADLVIGNPPFHINWYFEGQETPSHLFYCLKAAKILKPGGLLAVIVPSSFMSDDFHQQKQLERMDSLYDFVVQADLPSHAFAHLGVSAFSTKLMVFQRKSKHLPLRPYSLDKETQVDPAYLYDTYIRPLAKQRDGMRAKFLLESSDGTCSDKVFTDKATKLLYDIRCNRKTAVHLGRCEALVNQYLTQKKPDNVSYEEWDKIKLVDEKVFEVLKKTLSNANKVYRNERRIIKKEYYFATRDYSEGGEDAGLGSINDAVLQEDFSVVGFERLLLRKRREYENQCQRFEDMEPDPKIQAYLDSWSVYSELEERHIELNDVQKGDVNKLLQKRYGILQYEMGSGKTLCGLAMAGYQLQHAHIRNVFVVADALAVNNTWEVNMEDYGIPFYRVNTRADALNIPSGCIVLITLGMAVKYRKVLKNHVRICSQKVALIFDESDAISNPYSIRCKAMLSIFRRCRIKYLTTGTTTRNSIVESAPQLELIYNNSINYLSWAPSIYETDEENEEHSVYNHHYGSPIPAYRQGYKLFSKSHLPHKITVFGVEQFTQDIFNADALKELLDKTVITRTFEEVAGRKIYDITQVTVSFHQPEKDVYLKAIKEFHKLRYNYFARLENARKDSMFRILQQLILLLKICADPSSMKEYASTLESSKVVMMNEMLKEWENERVAIGVRHVDVAKAYAGYIKEQFPDRPVFLITGGGASFKRRREVVKELEKTKNGILLSTQQAYSKSQNIDFVDKILLPELHYNNAAMSQYYFRFIRYTSVNFKKVYYLTYENSIESNLIRMIMAKEKLNLFMKSQEVDDDDLYERFGVDRNLVNMLMTKEYDEEGHVHIRWGEQIIA